MPAIKQDQKLMTTAELLAHLELPPDTPGFFECDFSMVATPDAPDQVHPIDDEGNIISLNIKRDAVEELWKE